MAVKNAFATKLMQTKNEAYKNGMWDGMGMGLNIVAIALNHEFGFGETRLKRLEEKVQEITSEIVDTKDPVVINAHIEQALKQIRGEAYGT